MWEQIRANRRRSAILISTMAAVLLLLGYLGAEAIAPGAGPVGLLVAAGIWALQLGVYVTAANSVLLAGSGARELKKEDSPRLFNVVEEMCLAAGLGYIPKIYLIDDPAPNAFAIGRTPESSAVAVTTGLMHRLNRDELQGVIAHEIAHLKNHDVKFMTLAAVMLGSIVLLSELVLRATFYKGRAGRRSSSRGNGGGQGQAIIFVIAILFAILGPLAAQLLYFACSRKREYLADACAAQFTRYPAGLASALEKISLSSRAVAFANKTTAPLFIINPLAASGRSASLFSTHPPTEERIRILRSMGGAALADYETAFRKATGSGLIGPTSLQAAPAQPIRPPQPDEPIETPAATRAINYRRHGYLPLTCTCGLAIRVPETYERDSIHCVRCGSILPIPRVAPATSAPAAAPAPAAPLRYRRTTTGWESFRCACGHTVELSPAFAASRIRCAHCGRQIEVAT